jgi:hypothetical protein
MFGVGCGYMDRDAGPEHECRQGRRCKSRTRDAEGKWHGKGVERADTLCRSCEEHAFADIRQLQNDYRLLGAAFTEGQSHVIGPKVSGSTELPIPIPLAVDTLMSDINEETARWACLLPREGDNFTVICSALGTLVDLPPHIVPVWIPHSDGGDSIGETLMDGVDAVLRLSNLHRRAITVLGLEPDRDERLEGEHCHVCGLAALTSSLRTQLITCRSCHNVWHQDVFARLNNPVAA